MPAPMDQALTPSCPQLSNRSLVLCYACFFATCFGASAISVSVSLVLQSHAGSPAYWMMTALLLIIWFTTLINMYRITLAAILVER
jgi:hypothetical protein